MSGLLEAVGAHPFAAIAVGTYGFCLISLVGSVVKDVIVAYRASRAEAYSDGVYAKAGADACFADEEWRREFVDRSRKA